MCEQQFHEFCDLFSSAFFYCLIQNKCSVHSKVFCIYFEYIFSQEILRTVGIELNHKINGISAWVVRISDFQINMNCTEDSGEWFCILCWSRDSSSSENIDVGTKSNIHLFIVNLGPLRRFDHFNSKLKSINCYQ